jgi:hypothetical protein
LLHSLFFFGALSQDTIIKYGGKRKERSNIDIIFNMILPSSQPVEGAAPAAGAGG